MKKIVSLVAALALTCSVTACRAGDNARRMQQDRNNNDINRVGMNQGGAAGGNRFGTGTGTGTATGQGIGTGRGTTIGDGTGTGVGYGPGTGYGTGAGTGTGLGAGRDMVDPNRVGTFDPNFAGANRDAGRGRNIGTTDVTPLPAPTPNGVAQGAGSPAGFYRDGIYTAEGDRTARGYENATVLIRGGRIADITLRRFDARGTEITNENVNAGNPGGGGLTANIGQTKQELENQMMQAQTSDVTTSTTGDNNVVRNWKTAVSRALQKARR